MCSWDAAGSPRMLLATWGVLVQLGCSYWVLQDAPGGYIAYAPYVRKGYAKKHVRKYCSKSQCCFLLLQCALLHSTLSHLTRACICMGPH